MTCGTISWLGADLFTDPQEPDLLSIKPHVQQLTSEKSLLAPGYYFLAPYGTYDDDVAYGFGPQLYDNDLVRALPTP